MLRLPLKLHVRKLIIIEIQDKQEILIERRDPNIASEPFVA